MTSPSPGSALVFHRKLAKDLLKALARGTPAAARRFVNYHPSARGLDERDVMATKWKLADAQLVVAREARFESWPRLKGFLEETAASSGPDSPALFESVAELVVRGDVDALAGVLDRHPGLIQARSPRPHGGTLLHYSATNGVEDHRQKVPQNAVEVARLLVGRGADINAISAAYGGGPGSTPLVALVTSSHPAEAGVMAPMVAAFAESGQTLNGVDHDGLPMLYAFMFRNVSAAVALAEAGAPVENPACAAGLGDLERVRRSIDPGPPPTGDPTCLSGLPWMEKTPEAVPVLALYFASISGQLPTARWLIDVGCDVSARVHHGMTALHEACWGGHLDVVRLLVEAGADVDAVETQHRSKPIGWARHAGHEDVSRYLETIMVPMEPEEGEDDSPR